MKKGITVVGLGPGSAGHLSLETMAVLQSGSRGILRKAGVKFTSCDSVYEKEASFEDVYQKIVTAVLQAAGEQEVVYAVPGSPLVAERTVVMLREQAAAAGVPLKILPAMSFLDLAYVNLAVDPIAGF